jgi:hypothetical protein
MQHVCHCRAEESPVDVSFDALQVGPVQVLEVSRVVGSSWSRVDDGEFLDLVCIPLAAVVGKHCEGLDGRMAPPEDCRAYIGPEFVDEDRGEQRRPALENFGGQAGALDANLCEFCIEEVLEDARDNGAGSRGLGSSHVGTAVNKPKRTKPGGKTAQNQKQQDG